MNEIDISKAIIEDFTKNFLDSLELDVAIIGAGPSGLMCAYRLAQTVSRLLYLKGFFG